MKIRPAPKMSSWQERLFLQKVEKTESCWVWTGCRTKQRYGLVNLAGEVHLAHRAAYGTWVGTTEDELDHFECDNPPCVNPAHLRPSTHQENRERWALQLEACPKGHPKTEENIYIDTYGRRVCKPCLYASNKRCATEHSR